MRAPIPAVVFACTAFGAAPGGTAAAADLQVVPRGPIFAPAGQIIEWDFEPGVVVRAYWLPPYGGRHYFPTSGTPPQIGRKENLESSAKPEPAKSFYREWSSFPIEPGPAPLMGPLPADPSNQPSLK